MSGTKLIGLTVAIGLAVGAGGFGLLRQAAAESGDDWKPSQSNLVDPEFLPAVASQPPVVVPVLPIIPVAGLGDAPPVRAGLVAPPPIEVAPPTLPAKSLESSPAPRPVNPENHLQPAPPRHNDTKTELSQPPLPGFVVPGLPAPPVVLPPGDTTMPLTYRQMTLTALIGTAALTAPVVVRANPDGEKSPMAPATTPSKPEDAATRAQVADLQKSMDELKLSFAAIRELLEGKDKGTADDGLLKTIRRLESTLNSLDSKVKELEKRLPETTRTAGSSPLVGPPAPKATIRIVNEYPMQISMIVNATIHRIEANSTKDVSVPAGSFAYQLLTSGQTEVITPVKDGETLTLRVK